MVALWFLLALVLLVAALVLLRLDSRQRGRASGGSGVPTGPDGVDANGEGHADDGADDWDDDGADADESAPEVSEAPDDAATVPPLAEPGAGEPDRTGDDDEAADPRTVGSGGDGPTGVPGVPQPAPFQRGTEAERAVAGAEPAADSDPTAADSDGAVSDTGAGSGAVAAAVAAGAVGAGAASASSPRLVDRVRGLIPRRRKPAAPITESTESSSPEAPGDDPLAGSPVVRWLEEREFEPTPTPAPDLRHGDFAGGLPALGTVSHGVFRGRLAIMGVTGGRAVLALKRDTASDVVLDLSRPDVDAEPGFHDAGEVAALEARTSDVGRLDLVDRDRLAAAVRDVPGDVRRIWAEGEWVAATVDGADDPASWDDVVVALHGAADALAPLPPVGGRARPIPADTDPGAPGAADGPDADPAVGMDGEAAIGTRVEDTPATARTNVMPALRDAPSPPAPTEAPGDAPGEGADATGAAAAGVAGAGTAAASGASRRAGHLRLVPERGDGVRDLTDAPVVADRGDVAPPEAVPDVETDAPPEEPDPFAEIMEPSGPVPSRGDVAADHLEPRPPLSRPSRGAVHSYPEDASVPPLAAGATTGAAGIKPLGSEDDEDEIRTEVERFDAARIDGGSDLDEASRGRHGSGDGDEDGEDGRLSVAELAARMGATPSSGRRHRRRREEPEEPEDTATDSDDGNGAPAVGSAPGRERPGVDPDVETTASLRLPPDIRD